MIKHLGSKTVGALNVGLGLALPAIAKYLTELLAQKGDLLGRLDAYAQIGASLVDPTTVLAQLKAALAAFPSQLALIAAGALPTIGNAKAAVSADLGSLGLGLSELQTLYDQLSAAVSAGGVHAFSVDSTAATVGSELQGLLAGGMPGGGLPGARVRGVILLTEDAAAFESLSKVFLVS